MQFDRKRVGGLVICGLIASLLTVSSLSHCISLAADAADEAQSIAEEAKSTADDAQSDAEDAQSTADEAKSIGEEAMSLAEEIRDRFNLN